MQYPREDIYQAVFEIAAGAPGLKTSSRRNQYFANVPAEIQPALYMEQIGENPMQQGYGIPYKWELSVMFQIYVWEGDEMLPPSTRLNPIIDYLEQQFPPDAMYPPYSLQPSPYQVQNRIYPDTGTRGLVYECRLYGDGKSIAGSHGPQAFAFIPARIVAL